MMFRKRHPPAGSRPGTLALPADSPPPRIRVMCYTAAEVTEHDVGSPLELGDLLEGEGIAWIDVQGLGDEAVLRQLATTFSMHPLALEDVVNVPQRPTTDAYDEHQLYITRMFRRDESSELDFEQVSVFWSAKYVLTVQEKYGDILDPVRERLRQGKGPMRKSGPDYLAYAIIDAIIDGYYPIIDGLSEELESMEQVVIDNPVPRTLGQVNRIKRDLLDLRRGVAPQREAIGALVRGDGHFVTETVQLYLRDCYEHCVQIVDAIESHRELAAGLLNTYLSSVSNRTNEVMKVLTIMASIFIPLTFLAGIYGMNFEGMPELHLEWFYPLLLGLMVVIAIGMLVFFWKRGWLGSDRDQDA